MKAMSILVCALLLFSFSSARSTPHFSSDAAAFGFSPAATGLENTKALQKAVDQTGTIIVTRPGVYKMAGTVYIGSHTTLSFGNNIFLKKTNEQGEFTHVILNKGALTRSYDENILIEGLQIIVNGIDKQYTEVFGLRGQLAFFYVKDLKITRFRCLDLMKTQFCIQVCTFEDLLIDDVIIKGKKDGIHLGRGKRFQISNGVFQTFDDAIALNAHDYATSNPELGWIEDGVIENCHDLAAENTVGYFCRLLAGGWIDWRAGMEVRQSDAVVSNGRVYRVQADPDGKVYRSLNPPLHEKGLKVVDGINWVMVQNGNTYTAGVRNVIFRDIFLEKARTGIALQFDNDRYSRSYYPGAKIPVQSQFSLENIRVLHDRSAPLLSIATPVDVISISNSSFRNSAVKFLDNKALDNYLKTTINISACVFNAEKDFDIVTNDVAGKEIALRTFGNVELSAGFAAHIIAGKGQVSVFSDLTGLKK